MKRGGNAVRARCDRCKRPCNPETATVIGELEKTIRCRSCVERRGLPATLVKPEEAKGAL